MTNKFRINHSYKPVVYVPYKAIHYNIDFLLSDNPLKVLLADGKEYEVTDKKVLNISNCEAEIKSIYGIEAAAFVERWKKHYGYKQMTTNELIRLEIKQRDEE